MSSNKKKPAVAQKSATKPAPAKDAPKGAEEKSKRGRPDFMQTLVKDLNASMNKFAKAQKALERLATVRPEIGEVLGQAPIVALPVIHKLIAGGFSPEFAPVRAALGTGSAVEIAEEFREDYNKIPGALGKLTIVDAPEKGRIVVKSSTGNVFHAVRRHLRRAKPESVNAADASEATEATEAAEDAESAIDHE